MSNSLSRVSAFKDVRDDCSERGNCAPLLLKRGATVKFKRCDRLKDEIVGE